MDVSTKVLAISGAHRKGRRNTVYMLEQALDAASGVSGVETELIELRDKNISHCVQCEGCMGSYRSGPRADLKGRAHPPWTVHGCVVEDDVQAIHEKMEEANGIIFGNPTHLYGISSRMKQLIDRSRHIVHHSCLRWTVGASLTVAYFRNGGQETCNEEMIRYMTALRMVIVTRGAIGISGPSVNGPVPWEDDGTQIAVENDKESIRSARSLGSIVAQTAKVIKAGRSTLGDEEMSKFVPLPHSTMKGYVW